MQALFIFFCESSPPPSLSLITPSFKPFRQSESTRNLLPYYTLAQKVTTVAEIEFLISAIPNSDTRKLFLIFAPVMEEVKLHVFSADTSTMLKLAFADNGIKAGFPSPAQDYMSESIDLNKELIRHSETTFLARVSGNSLVEAGICDGDLVVIDKSLEAKSGDFVVAFIDGEFTLKEFRMDEANGCAWLIPHNRDYSPIKVTKENDFLVWGVLTYTIRQLRK